MKRVCTLWILLSTLFLSSLFAQGTVTIFGPRVFERSTGKPVTVTVPFSKGADAVSPFTMIVTNGAANGSNRASSATIKLNGVQIFSQSDFNQQVPQLSKSVVLAANNILEVQLASKPGSYLTINITATNIATAPVITISSPLPDIITNLTQVMVTGRVEGTAGTTATLNGSPLTLASDGTFSALAALPLEGANSIIVRAFSASGLESERTRTVIRDTQAPILTITSPINGSINNNPIVNINGTVSDPSPVILKVNNVITQIDSLGRFSAQAALTEGLNTITVVAIDDAGNQTTVTRTVRRDSQAPVLAITQPVDGLITNQMTVPITGTVTDETSVTVTINGNPVILEAGGVINSTIALAEGLNTITIIATDTVNNQTTVTRTVRRDTQSPVVNLTTPIDSLITNQQTVSVSGTVMDSTAVRMTINGNSVTLSAGGTFSYQLPVVEGLNTVKLIAIDAAGNTKSDSIVVIRDSQVPVLTLLSPIDSLITNQQIVNVHGTVVDSTSVELRVNGEMLLVGTNGAFSTTTNLIEGLNTIKAIATDAAGNGPTVIRTVILDTQGPVLTVTLPPDNYLTNQPDVVVGGKVFDSTAIQVTINGISLPVAGDGSFAKTVSLMEGTNIFEITATDAAGNSTQLTRMVKCDMIAPVLTVTSPLDNTTTTAQSIVVSGTVGDSSFVRVTVNGNNVEIGSDGAFSAQINLIAGLNAITITAIDTIGNSTTITRTVTQSTEVLPPDPATVAPVLDLTVPTTLATSTSFLYTGTNPIQKGVAPGTIDPLRVAVLRGKVLKRDLSPLSGVKITILNHPEYGNTLSRADGMFDIAVNGGGYLTIDYQKQGYLPLQRQIDAPWEDYVVVDSVVMTILDAIVTTIDFSDSVEVARGSVVTDQDGTRQATLFFRQGTVATMIKKNYISQTIQDGCNTRTVQVLTDSTIQELPTISVRATEYTVGETGPQAMPAELPPTSGYTYCIELSADEAINAGAKTILFNKPVPFYIENFLGLPVGIAVPVGCYDRELGVWVPVDDGHVVKITSISYDGKAEIDYDGDGNADAPDSLLIHGITEAEQFKLGLLYSAGQSLERIEINHFSTYDPNYGTETEEGSEDPDQESPDENNPVKEPPCNTPGSIIGIQNQSLGEFLPIAGTPFTLHYQSDRSQGRTENLSLTIPLSGDSIPSVLKKIHLEIKIAGQTVKKEFSPAQNLKYNFEWNRKDAYGRFVQGSQSVEVRVGYAYNGFYKRPPSYSRTFGLASDSDTLLMPTREDVIRWQKWQGKLGAWIALNEGLGGWAFNVHHGYVPNSRTIYFGNGDKRSAEGIGKIISTVSGMEGTGVPHSNTGADGTIFFSHSFSNQVYRRCVDGTVTVFAGTGEEGYSGNGGLATAAQLNKPAGLAVGQDGTVYIADQYNHCVRKVTSDGIITTVAGTGAEGYNGDWIQATQAQLSYPNDVAVAPDGSVYIADTYNMRIRRVDVNGMIITIVGTTDGFEFSGDGMIASQCAIDAPYGIKMAPNGNVYFVASNRILVITPDGIINTVAGTGEYGFEGDGGKAVDAKLGSPNALALGNDGTIYFSDGSNSRIRFVRPDGIIETLAGTGEWKAGGEGGPAAQASLGMPDDVFIGKDGSCYVSENQEIILSSTTFTVPDAPSFIRKISPAFPGTSLIDNYLPSEDGSELYHFSATGRHLRTLNALTHKPRLSFNYNSKGQLISIIDIDSLITTIERDSLGNPTAIVSPFGQRTVLTLNSNGYISAVKNPAEEVTQFTYSHEGLMTSMTDAKMNEHTFAYDTLGRLTFDRDPVGGFKQLDRTDFSKGYEITMTTAEGRRTKYRVENLPTGGVKMTNIDESGLASVSIDGRNGTTSTVSSDGTVSTTVIHPDPRFGMQAPLKTMSVRTPAGLISTTSQLKVISQMTGTEVTGMTESVVVNGRKFTNVYVATEGSSANIGTIGGIANYEFLAAIGSFTSIIGQDGTISAGGGDDATYSNIPIGFNFSFSGISYSQVAICSNGWISFNAGTSQTNYGNEDPHDLVSASNIYPFVAPLYDDLVVNGSIYYNTIGTAPNRKFTVEWNNVGWNYSNSGNSISFQAIFYEGTGVVQFVYAPGTDGIIYGGAAIGMANADGFLSVSDLTTSATISKTTENDYIAVEPSEGLTFSFSLASQYTSIDVPAGGKGIFIGISPEGRRIFSWINDKGRAIKDSIPGIEATYYNYDSQGRIMTISQAGRTASYTYDAKSFLATATDPIQRISRFEYDSVGRITRQVLPDNHEILYTYDANGNLTTLTPPTKPAHVFDYNKVDLTTQYAPPILGMDTLNTRYEYNKDKQIVRVLRPEGGVVEMIYDSVGCSTCGSPVSRPRTILFERGELDFKYSQFTGKLETLIAPAETLNYTYDGSFPKNVSWSGEVNGNVSVEYDNDYRVTSQSINGENTVGFSYDNDGLLTQTGDLSITREEGTGRRSGTTLGNVTTIQSYNNLGEPSSYEAKYGENTIFSTSYQRDSLGRITQSDEMVDGRSAKKNYAYDITGRLEKVWRNDTLISSYSYDANGNRLARTSVRDGVIQTDSGYYDSQDRMLSYSSTQYSYTSNGELRFKVEGNDTTHYTYDYFGNLITVVLPNKDRIDYIVDGQNRRIGKKVNGQIVKRWIYYGQLSPVAELDSANNVITRFVGSYMYKDGNAYQLITDHLGSIRLVVDVNTGNIAQKIEYDEFGNVSSNSNPDFQPLGYARGLYDTQTKLVRFGVRDYDASIGRWTIKDPILFAGGETSLYGYVGNDPQNFIDITGAIRLHTEGASNEQIEKYSNAYQIAYKAIANNAQAKEYFNRFGTDIEKALTPGEGPDVYLEQGNGDNYGYYNTLTNNIVIEELKDPQAIAATLIHEMGHWANDAGTWFGDVNPNIDDIKFTSPNPDDPPYGYAAEIVTFGCLY